MFGMQVQFSAFRTTLLISVDVLFPSFFPADKDKPIRSLFLCFSNRESKQCVVVVCFHFFNRKRKTYFWYFSSCSRIFFCVTTEKANLDFVCVCSIWTTTEKKNKVWLLYFLSFFLFSTEKVNLGLLECFVPLDFSFLKDKKRTINWFLWHKAKPLNSVNSLTSEPTTTYN